MKTKVYDAYSECEKCGKWHYTHADETHKFVEKQQSHHKLDNLLNACRKLKQARDERVKRVGELQKLAALARKTGKSQTHLIDNSPTVFDIGDVTDEIIEALEEYDKK